MGKVMVTPPKETGVSRVGPGLWRKHALPFTKFLYKGEVIDIDLAFAEKLKANFDAGVRDIVPVPAKGAGGHSDDWRDSKGNTVGLEVHPEKGVYVTVQVDEEADRAIAEKKLAGVSLAFDRDWFDPVAQQHVGPVLRHTALTNVPFIKGTEPFAPVSLSEDDELVLLAEVETPPKPPKEEQTMDLDQMKAALKKEHGVDLDGLTKTAEEVAQAREKAKIADGVRQALKVGGIELSEDAGDDDIVAAVKSAVAGSAAAVSLSERVEALETDLADERKARRVDLAESMVRPYLAAGLLGEADKADMVELAEAKPETAKRLLSKLSGNVLLTELASEHIGDGSGPADLSKTPARQFDGIASLSEDEQSEVERIAKANGRVAT